VHPLLEDVQLGLAHRPRWPQQWPVAVLGRVEDAVDLVETDP
jgi:hypothetical protein